MIGFIPVKWKIRIYLMAAKTNYFSCTIREHLWGLVEIPANLLRRLLRVSPKVTVIPQFSNVYRNQLTTNHRPCPMLSTCF